MGEGGKGLVQGYLAGGGAMQESQAQWAQSQFVTRSHHHLHVAS